MHEAKKLNEVGHCECGANDFAMMERIYTTGKIIGGILTELEFNQSEFVNAVCNDCGVEYGDSDFDELRLLPIGEFQQEGTELQGDNNVAIAGGGDA